MGWRSLAGYLSSIGIRATPDSLQARARRHGLTPLGTRRQGRAVLFGTADIEEWVRHLTGGSLRAWLADAKHGTPERPARPVRARPATSRTAPLPFDLYAIVRYSSRDGEQVGRLSTGELMAMLDPLRMEEFVALGDLPAVPWRCWRYQHARWASPTDLRPVSPSLLQRVRRAANTLIGGFRVEGSRLAWCEVPGPTFGLGSTVTTPFLATRALPGFGTAATRLQSMGHELRFVAWTRTVEIEPFTMHEVPHATHDLRVHACLPLAAVSVPSRG